MDNCIRIQLNSFLTNDLFQTRGIPQKDMNCFDVPIYHESCHINNNTKLSDPKLVGPLMWICFHHSALYHIIDFQYFFLSFSFQVVPLYNNKNNQQIHHNNQLQNIQTELKIKGLATNQISRAAVSSGNHPPKTCFWFCCRLTLLEGVIKRKW